MSNYIEFNPDAWASMKERDPEETIYMINLLKFRETVKEGLGIDGRKGRDVWMNKYGAGFYQNSVYSKDYIKKKFMSGHNSKHKNT